MLNSRSDRVNIALFAVFFAALPLDLALSGVLILVVAFIAYMFDTDRMLKVPSTPAPHDELHPSAESRSSAP